MAEKVWIWIAWKLPRPLVMWCAVRLLAHASGPQYPTQVVPELTGIDALERWDANA